MINVLLAYLALLLVCTVAEFFPRARRIDRLALLTLLVLGAATRPTPDHHETEVANAAVASASSHGVMRARADLASMSVALASKLVYRDFYVFSITTLHGAVVSVGLFDRVFVSGAVGTR